jgi:archaellum component FlaC
MSRRPDHPGVKVRDQVMVSRLRSRIDTARGELREVEQRLETTLEIVETEVRHVRMLVEAVHDDIRRVAEGVTGLDARLTAVFPEQVRAEESSE